MVSCLPLVSDMKMDKTASALELRAGHLKHAIGGDTGNKGNGNGVKLHASLQREVFGCHRCAGRESRERRGIER